MRLKHSLESTRAGRLLCYFHDSLCCFHDFTIICLLFLARAPVNKDDVAEQNAHKEERGWEAFSYPEFEGLSLSELAARLGM